MKFTPNPAQPGARRRRDKIAPSSSLSVAPFDRRGGFPLRPRARPTIIIRIMGACREERECIGECVCVFVCVLYDVRHVGMCANVCTGLIQYTYD